MSNPLSLPFALIGALAALPRALLLLEQAVVQAAALNETGAAALIRMDELNKRGDLVLEELAEARETFAEAMIQIDRLTAHGDAAVKAIEATRPTAERIAAQAKPMIEEARRARDQLRESHAELARANEQVARVLEMAEPLDRMTTRAQKIAGTLRRDGS
jgi:ABC-type transporter Mla subunit MlaD